MASEALLPTILRAVVFPCLSSVRRAGMEPMFSTSRGVKKEKWWKMFLVPALVRIRYVQSSPISGSTH